MPADDVAAVKGTSMSGEFLRSAFRALLVRCPATFGAPRAPVATVEQFEDGLDAQGCVGEDRMQHLSRAPAERQYTGLSQGMPALGLSRLGQQGAQEQITAHRTMHQRAHAIAAASHLGIGHQLLHLGQ